MNLAYKSVCPSQIEADFLKSYRQGERVRLIEMENERLGARIDHLVQELNARRTISSEEKSQLQDEIDGLKKTRAENDRQLSGISQ